MINSLNHEVCSGLWLRRRLGLLIEGVFRFSSDSIERLLHLEHRELDVFFQSRRLLFRQHQLVIGRSGEGACRVDLGSHSVHKRSQCSLHRQTPQISLRDKGEQLQCRNEPRVVRISRGPVAGRLFDIVPLRGGQPRKVYGVRNRKRRDHQPFRSGNVRHQPSRSRLNRGSCLHCGRTSTGYPDPTAP